MLVELVVVDIVSNPILEDFRIHDSVYNGLNPLLLFKNVSFIPTFN